MSPWEIGLVVGAVLLLVAMGSAGTLLLLYGSFRARHPRHRARPL